MIQKWIANFNNGIEAWSDHRRTGYPKFFPATDAGNKSGGSVTNEFGARRMVYPLAEYSNNGENVNAAVAPVSVARTRWAHASGGTAIRPL